MSSNSGSISTLVDEPLPGLPPESGCFLPLVDDGFAGFGVKAGGYIFGLIENEAKPVIVTQEMVEVDGGENVLVSALEGTPSSECGVVTAFGETLLNECGVSALEEAPQTDCGLYYKVDDGGKCIDNEKEVYVAGPSEKKEACLKGIFEEEVQRSSNNLPNGDQCLIETLSSGNNKEAVSRSFQKTESEQGIIEKEIAQTTEASFQSIVDNQIPQPSHNSSDKKGCLEEHVSSPSVKEVHVFGPTMEAKAGFQGIVKKEMQQISEAGFLGIIEEKKLQTSYNILNNHFEGIFEEGVPESSHNSPNNNGFLTEPMLSLNEAEGHAVVPEETEVGFQGIVEEDKLLTSHNSSNEACSFGKPLSPQEEQGIHFIARSEETEVDLQGNVDEEILPVSLNPPSENASLEEPLYSLSEKEIYVMGEKMEAGMQAIVKQKTLQSPQYSPAKGSGCVIPESISAQLSHISNTLELGSFKDLSAKDFRKSYVAGGATYCSGSVVDSSQHGGDEKRSEIKDNSVSLSNCTGLVHSGRFFRLTRARKAARECREAAANTFFLNSTIRISSEKARRKRSCSCKLARSSVWGELENIMQVFDQDDETRKFDPQLALMQKQGVKKVRSGGLGKEKCQKGRNSGSSRGSKGRRLATTNRGRAKIKKGGAQRITDPTESMLPEMVDSSASVQTVGNNCSPESDCRVDSETLGTANEVEYKLGSDECDIGQFSFLEHSLQKPIRSLGISAQHGKQGDKDLESTVTQDAFTENTSCGYPGVSSSIDTEASVEAVDNTHVEPGSSPDSGVLCLDMDACASTSMSGVSNCQNTSLHGGIRKRVHLMESRVQEAIQDCALTSSEVVHTPSEAVPSAVQRISTNKGKKNGRVRENLKPAMGCLSTEKKFLSSENMNKTKKSAKRRPAQKMKDWFDPRDGSNLTTGGNDSSKASNVDIYTAELPVSEMVELDHCGEDVSEICASSQHDFGTSKSEPRYDPNSTNAGNDSSKASNIEIFTPQLPLLEIVELDHCPENVSETCASSQRDDGTSKSESWILEGLSSGSKFEGGKVPRKSKVGKKCKSQASKPARRTKGNARESNKTGIQKSRGKRKVERKKLSSPVVHHNAECDLLGTEKGDINFSTKARKDSTISVSAELTRNEIFQDIGQMASNKAASEGILSSVMVPVGHEQVLEEFNHVSKARLSQPQVAWVRCDDCHKWRCISEALADEIDETNCKWTCKDNTDKAFADCSIPQEKSNAEINAELEITEASGEEDSYTAKPNHKGFGHGHMKAPKQASWTLIKSNLFLHRRRKTQTIDEIMVCHCKPPSDGSLGCGDACLNRVLNIECVQGTCPCGDLCSNQQFQKRKYAKFESFRCGKKGYGLQLLEDVPRGKFLIEYVGEVLDVHAYEARQREYAARGQKHFYFMTLNGSEVIDACAKGNLGRFINHSCDPNCRTEKWMVNGEVCIGLFAIRDIKKGEEVTFDYNYVRVFGAAVKKCVCGSSQCRGYIGGDPSNTEVIVQGDSDEEYLEPVMIHEDGESEIEMHGISPITSHINVISGQYEEISFQNTVKIINTSPAPEPSEVSLQKENCLLQPSSALEQLEISLQKEESISKSSSAVEKLEDSLPVKEILAEPSQHVQQFDISSQEEDTARKSLCTVQPLQISSQTAGVKGKAHSGSAVDGKASHNIVQDMLPPAKLRLNIKSSRPPGSIKKGRSRANEVVANKPRKLVEGTSSGRFEGVVEKLNELLDADGGISKRKDAARGYLKLLFVTAAAGDNSVNCEAFQSTRDLSLVLDALLKTKSRMVLIDIINKNGLQMLHNIMKQNRRNFNKIPVIRKLLKVLEFLAVKEVLTLEHINKAPPCPGMESFKESIMALIRHNDIQVHQMALRFRDKYIPRTIGKVNLSDRDCGKFDSQSAHCNRFWRRHDHGPRYSDAICVTPTNLLPSILDTNTFQTCLVPSQQGSGAPSTDNDSLNGMKKTRKRKSRWDQPEETNPNLQATPQSDTQIIEANSNLEKELVSQKPEICEVVSDQASGVNREVKKGRGYGDGYSSSQEEAAVQHVDEDSLPGFSHKDKDAPPGFLHMDGDASRRFSPIDDDVPPGFPSLPKNSQDPSSAYLATGTVADSQLQAPHSSIPCEAVTGLHQARFLSHLPVSHGVPLDLVEQLGTPGFEPGKGWVVAPAMPFYPFPPLPLFPRGEANPPGVPPATLSRTEERFGEATPNATAHHGNTTTPSVISGVRPPEVAATGARNPENAERGRWLSGGLGRRYFKQQKWNNRGYQKMAPWIRYRDHWGPKGNNHMRNELTSGGGNMIDNDGTCRKGNIIGTITGGGCSGSLSSRFHQPQQHQCHPD